MELRRRAIQSGNVGDLSRRILTLPGAPDNGTRSVTKEDSPDMKKPVRRTTVLIETERVVTFRSMDSTSGGKPSFQTCSNSQQLHAGWCFECGAETAMASVAYTARHAGLNELAIYHLLETGALHFFKQSEGQVLVCLDSLTEIEKRGNHEDTKQIH